MTVQRLDNTAIVVEDLDAAVAFFTALGLSIDGRAEISGPWADETVGLEGIRSEIAVLRTPDGHGRIELTHYREPEAVPAAPPAPNTIGLHRVMFAVDDLEATVERLLPHGAELLGEIAQYEDAYLLCYLRGPSGIIVALAQEIG
ncbi:catechol 2,3-dioxygenase-like lactoylglutathione lyase family enzyme [Pseudoclavibacter chungangensis]|uniref:VOC family protein n=1 Tax=Pseudoclavibacter chungangensis TaxID=587635 RepID=UPI0015C73907|nr:VOC family protein [Pseudoclavibacter chungangensis]NYJ67036.1 catechol 2,3-dioxygenase-like lactoylglutathione lyase family enzyme [Pseudoclavibacter chungangensis]